MTVTVLPNGTTTCEGYLYDLWDTVAHELGLRYRMVPLLKPLYGSMEANGTWNGMVGELAYGRADIAVTTLDMRSDRATVIDYIDAVSVTRTHSKFYVRASSHLVPEVTTETLSSLLKPLHPDVWWTLLVALLALAAALRVVVRCSHAASESRQTVERMGWVACLLASFRSLVGQGWESAPNSVAVRIVTSCSWMLGIIIYASYTANLISYLTVPKQDLPIRSLREFHEQPGWRLAVQPGHSILNDWKQSRSEEERALYRRSQAREGIIDIYWNRASTQRTLETKVLTYVNIDPVFRILREETCSLVPIPDLPVKTNEVYMAIAKGREDLRGRINQVMRRLNEEGLLKRIKGQWLKSNDAICERPAGFREMTFGDVFVILMIVPLGVVLSFVVFIETKSIVMSFYIIEKIPEVVTEACEKSGTGREF
ncbi:Glutamate receptor ionotropic, kainate 2 [Amphibalanus amphitrite]|uniref:Glutamate receptor ionotropic, kainate 2 n=1 Tax=Amphibalanus amphitrite TaxID=1232801 RepID=A0A6A4W9G4_AMPAM|nr:Glutamate receptor ionotropic, kainate 2 [Amphibalanus amphitrite]